MKLAKTGVRDLATEVFELCAKANEIAGSVAPSEDYMIEMRQQMADCATTFRLAAEDSREAPPLTISEATVMAETYVCPAYSSITPTHIQQAAILLVGASARLKPDFSI